MCNIALVHFAMLEDEERPPSKKRKTKKELEAEKARAAAREKEREDRKARCIKHRWSHEQIQCIVRTTVAADIPACVKTW
jgi:hypothetical protein